MKTYTECVNEAIHELGLDIKLTHDYTKLELINILHLAAKIYAESALDTAARSIHPFVNGERRKVMCNNILKLKDQLK